MESADSACDQASVIGGCLILHSLALPIDYHSFGMVQEAVQQGADHEVASFLSGSITVCGCVSVTNWIAMCYDIFVTKL
jgi:hypothetical protein